MHMQVDRQEGWIILRTAGRSTLRLAASLAEDGFDVWTPQREQHVRRPRWNVSRKVTLPILAGFVFARAGGLVELLELAAMPVKPRRDWRNGYRRDAEEELPPHPDFSVFRHCERIPLISDTALDPLRRAEKPACERRRYGRFGKDDGVRITEGSFQGMEGVVEKCGLDYAFVWLSVFGRQHRAKISTFILQPISAISGDIAARKAA